MKPEKVLSIQTRFFINGKEYPDARLTSSLPITDKSIQNALETMFWLKVQFPNANITAKNTRNMYV